jgi:serine protease Do
VCSQTGPGRVYRPVSTRSWSTSRLVPLRFVGPRTALAVAALAAFSCPGLEAKAPVPGQREDLAAVFAKGVPASIADLKSLQDYVEHLVKRVSPAVVAVQVDRSGGSGVVISPDGLVLCAAHVCGAPHRPVLFIFPDGRTARGQTLGTDHATDAGLMQITDRGPWPCVAVGDPKDTRLGEWVLALGHPGGFDPDRSIVARLGRVINLEGLLQSDCTLMAGDSGGPLFDMSGRVIGIHSRISESAEDNFHVPIAAYLESWDRLARGEDWGDERPPPRSTIGVGAVDHPDGCLLQRVNEGGPAFRAGLAPGDLIVRINGEPVTDAECLAHQVRQTEPGHELTLSIIRDGEELEIKVTVGQSRGPGRGWRRGR